VSAIRGGMGSGRGRNFECWMLDFEWKRKTRGGASAEFGAECGGGIDLLAGQIFGYSSRASCPMTAPVDIPIYHITDVANLRGIVAGAGLRSDVAMAQFNPKVIGYDHIKKRRATEIRVGCSGNRFVGEFAPFYYCPRSPMLYTINRGNTGRTAGCQRSIVHLVSKVGLALKGAADWAQRRECRGVSQPFLQGLEGVGKIGLAGDPGHPVAGTNPPEDG
jgi:hypothetical protein